MIALCESGWCVCWTWSWWQEFPEEPVTPPSSGVCTPAPVLWAGCPHHSLQSLFDVGWACGVPHSDGCGEDVLDDDRLKSVFNLGATYSTSCSLKIVLSVATYLGPAVPKILYHDTTSSAQTARSPVEKTVFMYRFSVRMKLYYLDGLIVWHGLIILWFHSFSYIWTLQS